MTDDFLSVKASASPSPLRNAGNLLLRALLLLLHILGQLQSDLQRGDCLQTDTHANPGVLFLAPKQCGRLEIPSIGAGIKMNT